MTTRKCDFCTETAIYDSRTKMGPWAFLCEYHFLIYGSSVPGFFTILAETAKQEKDCRLCGVRKPLTEFYAYKDANGKKRFRTECILCNLEQKKRAGFRSVRSKREMST